MRWITRRTQAGLLMACVLGRGSGCNGSRIPGDTGTVTGRATFKGDPIPEGSTIVFLHRGKGIVGTGVTDAEGAFSLQMREEPRVLVGEYSVGITPPGEIDPNNVTIFTDKAPDAWKKVPRKYWSPETSNETFTVKAGANDYQLQLKEK